MKTEQEQIEAIKQIIDERVETTLGQVQGRHGNVIKTVDTIIIARDIVEAGYGDVSEYKTEIERLRQEVRDTDKMARNIIEQYRAKNEELENALKQSEDNYSRAYERLKAQGREIGKLKDENEALKNDLINSDGNLNHITTEFEQLKAENEKLKTKCDDLKKLSDWQREEIKILKDEVNKGCDNCETIKQGQVDVLKGLRERITKDRVANDTVVINASYEIDELIKEIRAQ